MAKDDEEFEYGEPVPMDLTSTNINEPVPIQIKLA
jgi:hypothetical protein